MNPGPLDHEATLQTTRPPSRPNELDIVKSCHVAFVTYGYNDPFKLFNFELMHSLRRYAQIKITILAL